MELIGDFVKRRHGEIPVEYPHPMLEGISKETYGVLIYQEQVMQAAQILAGYTLGGADLLRRAMGKKKVEEMQKQREKFVKGAKEHHNIPPTKANQVFDLLEKFAGYGFNKSHAAAYAVVAYQTAYLKANFPVEFYCAMMTNDMAATEKLSEYIAEAREVGIEVLGPDVNESHVHFAPAPGGKAIRFGLAAVKGVGEVAVESLLKARADGGPFKSLSEMCERVDGRTVNRRVLEAFIKTGACDTFGMTRATMFAQIERSLARAAGIQSDKQKGQSSLFGALEEKSSSAMPETISNLPEWPQHELLAHEKELLGFYVTGHPLTPLAPLLQKYSLHTTAQLATAANRSMTRLGGMIAAVSHGVSKKSGKPYSMVTLEDLEGSVQLLVMNDYDKFRPLLEENKALLVVGEVSTGEDKPKVFPQEIMPLGDAPLKYTRQVHLRLPMAHLKPEDMDRVRQLTAAHAGKCPLYLCFLRPEGGTIFVEAHTHFSVKPSLELEHEVNRMFGEKTYYAVVDKTPPEKPRRVWGKKGNGGNGDE
jgi:DNA polymerase-3 subunit alpha